MHMVYILVGIDFETHLPNSKSPSLTCTTRLWAAGVHDVCMIKFWMSDHFKYIRTLIFVLVSEQLLYEHCMLWYYTWSLKQYHSKIKLWCHEQRFAPPDDNIFLVYIIYVTGVIWAIDIMQAMVARTLCVTLDWGWSTIGKLRQTYYTNSTVEPFGRPAHFSHMSCYQSRLRSPGFISGKPGGWFTPPPCSLYVILCDCRHHLDLYLHPPPPPLEVCCYMYTVFAPSWAKSWNKHCN